MTEMPYQPDLLGGLPVGGERHPLDAYDTPPWATRVLLEYAGARLNGLAWECCAGAGAIVDVLETHDPIQRVFASDFAPRRDDVVEHDFLRRRYLDSGISRRPDHIVTNPPYLVKQPDHTLDDTAADFVKRATDIAVTSVWMLLRWAWLEPVDERVEFLQENPPTDIVVIPRVHFHGAPRNNNGCSAWLGWERGKSKVDLEFYGADDCIKFGRRKGRR